MWTRWQSHILHAAAPAGMPMLVVRKTSFTPNHKKPQEKILWFFVASPGQFCTCADTAPFHGLFLWCLALGCSELLQCTCLRTKCQ